MNLNLVVAMSKNHVIGVNNQLPWHLPADLKHFKSLTLHHPIVMGRKTFESIGRPLPGRANWVLTRDLTWSKEGIQIAHHLEEVFEQLQHHQEVFIVGGETLYRQTLPLAHRLYITEVEVVMEGDAFFPHWDPTEWTCVSKEQHTKDERHAFDYCFQVFKRIAPLP